MYAELSAAVSSAKAALELAQAAKGLANFNEVVAAVSEVNTKLMAAYSVSFAAQEKQVALLEQVAALKAELVELRSKQDSASDYKLIDAGSGVFAFAYKPAGEPTKPPHLACVKSFTVHGLGILQDEHRHYKCSVCGEETCPVTSGHKSTLEEIYAKLS